MDTLPQPRTPDPREAPSLRWGVLGTGWIAGRFVAALRQNTTQRIQAVGSRSQDSADRFAAAVGGGPTAHGSYDALVADPAVDIVYVATPHNYHHAHALLAIDAGNHVLIEKPVAIDEAQAQQIADRATEAEVFAMEALWTFFLPKFDVIRQVLDDVVVESVIADMGEYFDADHRIYDAELAGGPLFDLGTYPISLAQFGIGELTGVTAIGGPAPNGINGQIAMMLTGADGGIAALHSSILGYTSTAATIAAADLSVAIDGPFYQPGGFTVVTRSGTELRYDEPQVAHTGGLHFSAVEAARRIVAGETGSPIRPMRDSVEMLRIMDDIRLQAGIPNP